MLAGQQAEWSLQHLGGCDADVASGRTEAGSKSGSKRRDVDVSAGSGVGANVDAGPTVDLDPRPCRQHRWVLSRGSLR